MVTTSTALENAREKQLKQAEISKSLYLKWAFIRHLDRIRDLEILEPETQIAKS